MRAGTLLAAVLAVVLGFGSAMGTAQAGAPLAWKASGFSIDADGMRLRTVLQQFAQVYDVRLQMAIKGERLLKGRLKGDSGAEFLNRLAQAGGFRWFVYGDTLYVVAADDNASLRLEVGDDAVHDAKAALVGVGLFDERFGWGELPDTGTVIVSGPRAYVDLAREILMPDTARRDAKARRVMMFRLKYASVSDRVITVRGQSEKIPGVKTMLTNLLFGPGSGSGSLEQLADPPAFDAASHKRTRGSKNEAGEAREVASGKAGFLPIFGPPGGAGMAASVPAPASSASGSGLRQRAPEDRARPRIEANPALNAIMIYDSLDQRPMYAALIAELDVQPQQIEIEALIVDIDRSKLAEMGVEWGVRAGAVETTVNSSLAESLGTATPLAGATLLISDAARFYARLKAMESNGDARVLATPTVLTIDNVAAVLDLSQTSYVSLVGERVADLADVTAGTMLRVIPRVIREGAATRVHLEVDIEDGSLDSPANGGKAGNGNVNVTRSTISTQAIIDSQQTLMIGGYRAERLALDRQKVPLLGDLPLVGGLFRSEARSRSTRERLFLLTPRLAAGGVQALAMSAAGARGREVTREAMAASPAQSAVPPAPVPAPAAPPARPLLPLLPPAPPPARRTQADGKVPLPPGAPPVAAAAAPPPAQPWALIPAAASATRRAQ